MTVTVEVPGVDVDVALGAIRVRTRDEPAPGVEAPRLEYRDALTGDLLAVIDDEHLGWTWTEEVRGLQIRTSLDWSLPAGHPSHGHLADWDHDVVLHWPVEGRVAHRGPHMGHSVDVESGAVKMTSPDYGAWLSKRVCPHPWPGDEERTKWDEGRRIAMRLGWDYGLAPAIGGGELSTSTLIHVDSYAGKSATSVADLVVLERYGGDPGWWWMEHLPDWSERVSYGPRGRVIDRGVLELRCVVGERGNCTRVAPDVDPSQIVTSPAIICRDGRQVRRPTPSGTAGGLILEEPIPARAGFDEGPDQHAQLTYQAVVDSVGAGEALTVDVADRAAAALVRAGDQVWVECDAPGAVRARFERVLRIEVPAIGPARLTMGDLPPRDTTDFFREMNERIRRLEEERNGARSSSELTDWDVETVESAAGDPEKLAKVPRPGQNPRAKAVTRGGVTRVMWTAGPALDPSSGLLVTDTAFTDPGGFFWVPVPDDWDPERGFIGTVSVSIQATTPDPPPSPETQIWWGGQVIAGASPTAGVPPSGPGDYDVSGSASVNTWASSASIPVTQDGGWPWIALIDLGCDGTVSVLARLRQI